MTDDRSLHDRLVAVADAVPVTPPSPVAGLTRRPVTLGPALRAPLSRSWLPVALVAMLVVAAVGILASGSQPAYGPVVETVRQGDFELTLRAEKGRYAPDEPIEIEATLTYVGADEGLDIRHAQGAGSRPGVTGSPLGFGTREPVIGDLRLEPVWQQSCELTHLSRDVPLRQPFEKAGGWSNSDPRADEYRAWTTDPVLRLGSGTWHVFAIAEFSVGACGAPDYVMDAEIAITVGSPAPSATERPSPTELANPPQSSNVRDGDFELTIRSRKTRYTTDEAVDVSASLVYRGSEAAVDVSGGWVSIWSRETRDAIFVGAPSVIAICAGTTFERDIPHEMPGILTVRQTGEGIEYQEVPRLPAGIWHLYATAGTCAPGLEPDEIEFDLEAEITIEVTDESSLTPKPTPVSSSAPYRPLPLYEIPLWTAPEPQKGCRLQYHEGILVRHPESGLGIIEGGTLKAVRWPYWARAIDQDGTAMLLGPNGQEVAHEGDLVSMSGPGGPGSDDVINACEDIGVVVSVEPS